VIVADCLVGTWRIGSGISNSPLKMIDFERYTRTTR
jgi:hypothetical protein